WGNFVQHLLKIIVVQHSKPHPLQLAMHPQDRLRPGDEVQVTGPLIHHQLKEGIELRHDVFPMGYTAGLRTHCGRCLVSCLSYPCQPSRPTYAVDNYTKKRRRLYAADNCTQKRRRPYAMVSVISRTLRVGREVRDVLLYTIR